jgi:hypothetical protein
MLLSQEIRKETKNLDARYQYARKGYAAPSEESLGTLMTLAKDHYEGDHLGNSC